MLRTPVPPPKVHNAAKEIDSDNDDSMPPLEDASDTIARARAATKPVLAPKPSVRTPSTKTTPRDTTTLRDLVPPTKSAVEQLLAPAPPIASSPPVPPCPAAQQKVSTASTSLGGLRRGFLNSPAQPVTDKKWATATDPVPLIKPRASASATSSPFVFSEVQDALRATDPSVFTQSPDVLSAIDSDKALAEIFADEGFGQFLAAVQKDPVAATRQYPRSSASASAPTRADRYWEGFRVMTGVMGGVLEKKASSPTAASAAVPLASSSSAKPTTPVMMQQQKQEPAIREALPRHEQELVDRCTSDPRVRDALTDPAVQAVLAELKARPGQVPSALRGRKPPHPALMTRLQVLVQVGLLQMQL